MKLAECLNAADISSLRSIADQHDLSCSRHSKLSLLQEILYHFRSRNFLEHGVGRWLDGREYAMLRICLETRHLFSLEELTGVFQDFGGEDAVNQSEREGWLFPTTRFGGRLLYCIPQELHDRMREVMVERFASKVASSLEGPLLYQEEGQAMVRDLDVFLEYIRHHEVRLTTDGSLYKRNLQQVLELLEVPEEPLQSGWRFGYGRRFHDYPDRFALVYDYAFANQLISEGQDGFLALTDDVDTWRTMSSIDKQKAFLRFYISSYRRPIRRLPQVVQLVAHAALQWVNSLDMLQALGDLVPTYYYDERENVWSERILKMMMHLGCIRLGEDENGQQWFQITELGQQLLTPDALPVSPDQTRDRQRILIVQPNFEIVVTAEQPMITAQLALFTELRQAGVVRVYRMTEESVHKGVKAGKSLSSWLEFLQTCSQTPVPGNVERMLEEWNRTMEADSAAGGTA